jgi:hypothetical protein
MCWLIRIYTGCTCVQIHIYGGKDYIFNTTHRHTLDFNLCLTRVLFCVLTDKSNTSLDGNMTWPMYGDLASGLGRTDNLSCSLPVRESTPGGPASRNRQSDFPSQNTRQSDFPSHHSRKSDLPSQHSRQTERTS